MTVIPRIAWVAAAIAAPVLAFAPVASAAPVPCGGTAQITDASGDGHHQNSDVISAWFSGTPEALQAVITLRLGLFEPAHDDSDAVAYAMIFRTGTDWRYVRAIAGRAAAITYEYGTWSPLTYFQPFGSTTGSATVENGSGVVAIDIPTVFGITPVSTISTPFVMTNDGMDGGIPHWVDRAPGGVAPDSGEYGADLVVGACSTAVDGATGVTLSGPVRMVGAGTARVTGVVAGAQAGVAVTLIATGVVTRTYTSTTTGGGAFTASIPIRATTTIRATAAGLGSPTITVISRERVTVKGRVRASRSATVVVSPALPGRALLLRPVGFQPLATARVRNGVATLHVPASAVGRAQVVIIPDGGRAERAQSSIFRIQ